MTLDSIDVQGEDATDYYHQINVDALRSNLKSQAENTKHTPTLNPTVNGANHITPQMLDSNRSK